MEYADKVEKWRKECPQGTVDVYDKLLNDGCGPRHACAVVTYCAGLLDDRKVLQHEVSEEFDVSKVTIRKWYHHAFNEYNDFFDRDIDPAKLDGRVGYDQVKTKEDLEKEFYLKSNLNADDYGSDYRDTYDITHRALFDYFDVDSKMELMDVLEEQGFSSSEDFTIIINLKKSGIRKLVEDVE